MTSDWSNTYCSLNHILFQDHFSPSQAEWETDTRRGGVQQQRKQQNSLGGASYDPQQGALPLQQAKKVSNICFL